MRYDIEEYIELGNAITKDPVPVYYMNWGSQFELYVSMETPPVFNPIEGDRFLSMMNRDEIATFAPSVPDTATFETVQFLLNVFKVN